jgi:glycerate 2-kinase
MSAPRFSDHREHVWELVHAALRAADPEQALTTHWKAIGDLSHYAHCWVVGFGKASAKMARALARLLGDRLDGGAIAALPDLVEASARYRIWPAAHPLPDERNIEAARAIAQVAADAGPDDWLVCLVSGGGSAHLTLPASGLTLEGLRRVTERLLRAGAPIQDLNAVRKHCEQLKGGGLARLAAPAKVMAFILSDVMGDPLDTIASGPTAPDPTTYQDALNVLARYDALDAAPTITRHLRAGACGERPETPKPGDPALASVQNTIIGSNGMAVQAAARHAEEMGFAVQVAPAPAVGEARELGAALGEIARNLPRSGGYIVGGETTVTVRGGGRGGRNQEVALAAALAIDGIPDVVVASFATDGIDGPTDAAGALVTDETCARARETCLDLPGYLDNNDSYSCLRALDALLFTGATGTNVNDLAFVLAY